MPTRPTTAQRRRRLLLALGGIALLLALSLALVSYASHGRVRGSGHRGSKSGNGGGRGLVRNATPQADWGPHKGPVPIIEYHVIGDAPADAPYPDLYVTRPDFHHQMDWLDRHGYEAVTLEQVQKAWYDGGTLPPKPVVISFDDGYRPQFTFALPQLRKHGWAGLLNLKAEGSDLYDSNVEAMIAAGWEIAAHTIHHSDLTTLDAAALEEEVAGSRAIVRREYGVPVRNFCYPSGRFDEAVIAAVKAAGYRGATSEIPGYAERDQPYELQRLEIPGSAGPDGLASYLDG